MINQKRIYPPRHGTAQEILAAAAPTVQAPPQYPRGRAPGTRRRLRRLLRPRGPLCCEGCAS
jgi:hypothetical protein